MINTGIRMLPPEDVLPRIDVTYVIELDTYTLRAGYISADNIPSISMLRNASKWPMQVLLW